MMDAKTFVEMYEKVYKDMFRFALCMLRQTQDAEDAVMEAVLSAYENVAKLRKEESFRAWIFQILANVCRKKLKLKKKNQTEPLMEQTGEHPANQSYMAEEPDHGMRMDVQKAFFILSEEEQLIVALSVFGGYKSGEIGKMLGLNANTVRSKRSRALSKMECVLG